MREHSHCRNARRGLGDAGSRGGRRAPVPPVRAYRLAQVGRDSGHGGCRGVALRPAPAAAVSLRSAAASQRARLQGVRPVDAGEGGFRSGWSSALSGRRRVARHYRYCRIVHPGARRAVALRSGATGVPGQARKAMDSLPKAVHRVLGGLSCAERACARRSGLGRL